MYVPAQRSATHLAHGGIVRFVLVQFLLHSVSELEHLFILSRKIEDRLADGRFVVGDIPAIANVGILAECRAQGGDLLGDRIEMCRALRTGDGWIVRDVECVR